MVAEATAETRRLLPIDAASMVGRPETVESTYVEQEYDELAAEQLPLWQAEGAVTSRADEATRRESRPGYKVGRAHLRDHEHVVENVRAEYVSCLTNLGPYRHREPGAKKWYLAALLGLLGGDIAGQAGAALMYGEHPLTAVPQALATGMAAVTVGRVGSELRTLRDTGRRQYDDGSLPEGLERWSHLFRDPDRGLRWAKLVLAVGLAAAFLVAGGVFTLRASVDGSTAGFVYGLLSLGIVAGSLVNAYFYADEIADQISLAEADYAREIRRSNQLAQHPDLVRHSAARVGAESIREEHAARGEAAERHLRALKWRVLGNNPGIAGHGTRGAPKSPIGRRSRGGQPS